MDNSSQSSDSLSGCCEDTHTKIFEIFLIIGFILTVAGLTINFVFTMFFFFYSSPIFFIEIGLMALNFFCFIFSILLRVWRSNGSVLNENYSSSLCVSLFILIFSIINLLGSIVEDIIFILTMDCYVGDGKKCDEKKSKISEKIFDKHEKMNGEAKFLFIDEKILLKLLEILPFVSMNFNALVQILNIIFIIIIRKRINLKSDFGKPMPEQTQKSISRKRMNNNKNSGTNLTVGNNNTKEVKSKNKKGLKYNNAGTASEQEDMMIKKKIKKKKSKKRLGFKIKRKKY